MPLVYGRNAPGSFESINRYINKKYFFPIPVLDNENQRTFCNVQNISDKIEEVLENINSSTIMNIVNPDSFSTFALISSVLKRRRNHVLRIPVNDFFNKLLLRIPFLNNFYKKYYSNFVVSSIHHKAIFEDVDFSTINDVGKFLK